MNIEIFNCIYQLLNIFTYNELRNLIRIFIDFNSRLKDTVFRVHLLINTGRLMCGMVIFEGDVCVCLFV